MRIELTIEVLQTSALPLGYRALALKLAPVGEKIHLRPGGMRCWQDVVFPSRPQLRGQDALPTARQDAGATRMSTEQKTSGLEDSNGFLGFSELTLRSLSC